MQALEDLDYLAALDDDGNLSEVGIIMSEFPLDPQLAKALIASCEFDCVDEMVSLAAMLTGGGGRRSAAAQGSDAAPGIQPVWGPVCASPAPPCFVTPSTRLEEAVTARRRALLHPDGDHFTLINIFNAFQQRECWAGARLGPGRTPQLLCFFLCFSCAQRSTPEPRPGSEGSQPQHGALSTPHPSLPTLLSPQTTWMRAGAANTR